jgi:serine protease AprX
MKKYLVIAGAVAIALGINSVDTSTPASETLAEYILQGAEKTTILKDVDSVGGVVIHQFSVIDAISVRLSSSQLADIKKLNPMLKTFKDQEIEVANAIESFSSDNVSFDLNNHTATWNGVNSSNNSTSIEAIYFNMPYNNESVESIEVNGQRMPINSNNLNGGFTLGSNEQIELGAGQVIKVKIKFAKLVNTHAYSYQLTFVEKQHNTTSEVVAHNDTNETTSNDSGLEYVLTDDTSNLTTENYVSEYAVTNDITEPSSNIGTSGYTATDTTNELSTDIGNLELSEFTDVSGKLKFSSQTNEVNWTVANVKQYTQALAHLKPVFPEGNRAINTLSINDTLVGFENNNGVLSLTTPINVQANTAINIKLEFESLVSVSTDDYDLGVYFDSGEKQNVIVPLKTYAQGRNRDTHYPTLVRANEAHQMGITGEGVTVAILDTGLRWIQEIEDKTGNVRRNIARASIVNRYQHDETLVLNEEGFLVAPPKLVTDDTDDGNGHGTHLASIIANSSHSIDANGNDTGGFNGIAPDVNLVLVKAFDRQGQSSYLDILKAVEYVVENKDRLNIQVLNLSFSALPSSYYWDDPLNQALMKAWDAGITVIAAAGNRGPDAMTIGVPGNTPYLITVGAVSDNYTPDNLNDDFVTTFSSAGPTYEGFVKPDLVAPGGHIQGLISGGSLIRTEYPLYNETGTEYHNYYEMSGSSQSTAVTSGIVALMLQANPNLSPDDIKCRLIATAKAATNDAGELAFSVFQQGAGLVDAMAAIESTEAGCSNAGLSIAKDLSGEEHFIGPARRYENDGDYYIPGVDGLEWSGVYTDSQLWRNSSFNADSQLWRRSSFNSDSQLWRHTSFSSNSQLWRNSSFSADSQLWRNSSFSADSQLWRNSSFSADSQLWRRSSFNPDSQMWTSSLFNADSIPREWVDHE